LTYTWFYIFNQTEFAALGLVSREYTLNLEGIGFKTILVTKGEGYGMLYDGVFLSLNLNSKNPFKFDSKAIYIDASNNVWLGILN
jgi:hypothetical protein